MSSNKSKKSDANKYAAQAASYLKPTNYDTPFGGVKKGQVYVNEPGSYAAARTTAADKLYDVAQETPTAFNLNDYFDNPYYQNTLDFLNRGTDKLKSNESTDLTNNLSARNQLGSSYDALMRDKLNQRYDQQYANNENQARQQSTSAYGASIDQNLAAQQALQNLYSGSIQTALYPAQLGAGYQSAVAPLNTAAAGIYGNMANQAYGAYANTAPKWQQALNAYNSYVSSNAQMIGALAGV